jgi:tol-pal system protein YbgF
MLLAGCIPTQRELRMERDLEEMKRRLAETERSMAAQRIDRTGEVRDRTDALARNQADLQAALDALRVEIQGTGGRFEDLTRQNHAMRDELSLVRDDLGLRLSALETRVGNLEQSAAARPAQPAASPASSYDRGLEMIQKRGEFAQGRDLLDDFLRNNPQHPMAVNAMYWIGEAYYGEKKFENAILQFQDVIQKYGEHPKVAAALLKQGLAFHALGDLGNARTILQRVIDTFPLSEEAKKARERLTEWDRKR